MLPHERPVLHQLHLQPKVKPLESLRALFIKKPIGLKISRIKLVIWSEKT